MAHGLEIFDASGDKLFDSNHFSGFLLDVFTVGPNDSNSVVYNDKQDLTVRVIQSTVEPSSWNHQTYMSFTTMSTSVTYNASSVTVSYSPGVQVGTTRNVILYILGY